MGTRKNMLRWLSLVMVSVLCSLDLLSASFSVGNLKYETIAEGEVKVIGYKTSPTAVSIPASINYAGKNYKVVEIGEEVFSGCSGLTEVAIGTNLKVVGDYAFQGCSQLTSIDLGENTTTIGDYAFKNCGMLRDIVIPNSITHIHPTAFSHCTFLNSITVLDGNQIYKSIDGVLCSVDGKEMLIYPFGKIKENIELPEGIEIIGENLFESSAIQGITLPNSLLEIKSKAFYGCDIKSIVFPPSLKTINSQAFACCDSLKNVVMNGQIENLGSEVFSNTALLSMDFTSVNMENIPYGTFAGCKKLEDIKLSQSIRGVNSYAFSGCSSLLSFEFPESLLYIGDNAFHNAAKLSIVDLSNTLVVTIGNNAFKNCTGATDILLPEGLVKIGDGVFYGCSNVNNMTIPNTVEEIGTEAFAFTGLKNIKLSDSITILSKSLFEGCMSLKTFTFPLRVSELDVKVFKDCVSLDNIIIPDAITKLPADLFYGCKSLKDIRFPNQLQMVEDRAFKGCESLEVVSLPSKLQKIGSNTFCGCSNLSIIEIPKTVNEIGNNCFANCISLAEISIPAGIKEISEGLLLGCTSLKKVTFGLNRYWSAWGWPNRLYTEAEIHNNAFSECTSLEEIHVLDICVPYLTKDDIKNVNCKDITVYIPTELYDMYKNEWGNFGFKDFVEEESDEAIVFMAQGFTVARHNDDWNKIDIIDFPSWKNFQLTGDISIPEMLDYADRTLTVVGVRGSSLCNKAVNIHFPKTIEYIGGDSEWGWLYGDHLFNWANNLKSITVDSKNEHYFSERGVLYKKNIPSLLHIPVNLSDSCGLVTNYVIPEGVKCILSINTSYDANKLKCLSIPESVDSIADDAFSNILFDTVKIFSKVPPSRPHIGGIETLYVPYGCKKEYENANNAWGHNSWSSIENIIEMPNAEPITLTAKSYTRIYGEKNPVFEYIIDGAELCGIPNITCEATVDSPIGEYPIVITKGGVENINDTYVDGVLTIVKAPLIVQAENAERVYGDENPKFTFAYNGFKNEETHEVLTNRPSAKTEAIATSGVGTYDIVPSGAEAQNYDITYKNGSLIVTKAPLAVSVVSNTKEYGEDNPTVALTYSGFKNSDNENCISEKPAVAIAADRLSDVGEYAITVSGGKAQNYEFTEYNEGVLTVEKAPLTVIADNKGRLYFEANPEFTFRCEGFKNEDTKSVITTEPSFECSATQTSNVGEYAITLSGAEAKNYELSYQGATLTIGKQTIDVKVGDCTRIYNEENPEFEVLYSGFVNNESEKVFTVMPTVQCEADKTTDVGAYEIIASGGEAVNYDFNYTSGMLTIEKASQEIVWEQDLTTVVLGDQVELTATATSGLAIEYELAANSIVSIYEAAGNVYLDCFGAGEVIIKAIQQGNKNYHSAVRVTKKLVITDPSGVESIFTNAEDAPIYNLQGERMACSRKELQKGIYIQNGRKFVVK